MTVAIAKYNILSYILFACLLLSTPVSADVIQRTQPLLIVLVEFNDVKHTYNKTYYDKLFFSQTTKSVYSYYKEVSYGNMVINRANDDYPVSGDNNGSIGWININQNHPNCSNAEDEDTCNRNLVTASLQTIGPYIDFSNYDTNADGKILPSELSIVFVVAGYESSYSGNRPAVGANQFYLINPVTLNDKQIYDYVIVGEKHNDHPATMGVMAHELGHLMLGLPDLYDTTYSSQGAGRFDLMANGSWNKSISDLYEGETPVHLSTWAKKFSHFVSPSTISSDQIGVQLSAVANTTTSVIQLNPLNSTEYFLVENRQLTNYDAGFQSAFNATDTNGGIAIWHIDDSLLNTCIIPNNCNNNPTHKLTDLEEADGSNQLDESNDVAKLQYMYFSGNNSIFNDSSNPNSKLYNSQSSNIAVVNISSPANIMTLDII